RVARVESRDRSHGDSVQTNWPSRVIHPAVRSAHVRVLLTVAKSRSSFARREYLRRQWFARNDRSPAEARASRRRSASVYHVQRADATNVAHRLVQTAAKRHAEYVRAPDRAG